MTTKQHYNNIRKCFQYSNILTIGILFFMMGIIISCTAEAKDTGGGYPEEDRVHSLPMFETKDWTDKFSVYSGFLNVTYPEEIGGYDGVVIHYQFHTSQGKEAEGDRLAIWHTGGPGGSSIYGQYSEMGPFQVFVDEETGQVGTALNPYAWNNVANMLYLEAPAGSFLTPVDLKSGFSYCLKDGKRQDKCHWNDRTQAQSYAYTLKAFFEKFPALNDADIFLAGESYGGQYVCVVVCLCIAAPFQVSFLASCIFASHFFDLLSSIAQLLFQVRSKHRARDLVEREACGLGEATQRFGGGEWLLGWIRERSRLQRTFRGSRRRPSVFRERYDVGSTSRKNSKRLRRFRQRVSRLRIAIGRNE